MPLNPWEPRKAITSPFFVFDTRKSINLGIFEFEGYLFEVQHSARKKFFEDNKINIPEKPQQENEATKGK